MADHEHERDGIDRWGDMFDIDNLMNNLGVRPHAGINTGVRGQGVRFVKIEFPLIETCGPARQFVL